MDSSHHPYSIASKPVAIKHRPGGDYHNSLVHLPASSNDKANLVVESANYSMNHTMNERHETQQDLSFDINPTPIQPQGVRVVDRVQLSSWLPPDGFTVDFLQRLLILGQQQGEISSSTESSAYRPKTTSRSAPKRSKEHTLIAPTQEYSDTSSDSSYCGSEYQRVGVANQWADKFQELVKFKDAHGHCHVPHNWASNYSLAQWVKRQRYQYKLRAESQHSNLTSEREEALEKVGFVWNPQGSTWEERLNELAQYVTDNGHSNVPKNYLANPSLAVWVKCQRRQFKLFTKGVQSAMTKERTMKLKEIGFIFNPRSSP
jgi:hypothetical protein